MSGDYPVMGLDLFGVSAGQEESGVEVLMRHLGLTPDEARYEIEWLAKRSFGDPPPFVWRQEDRRNLDEFWRALRTIATIDDRLSPGASESLRGCFVRNYLPEGINELPEGQDKVAALSEFQDKVAALSWLERLHELMKPVIPLVEAEIARGPAEGQTNWDGMAVIDACRTCWLRNTGNEAPARGLNLASPFGKFVQDIFEALEMNVTAGAAFKAWTRQKVPS